MATDPRANDQPAPDLPGALLRAFPGRQSAYATRRANGQYGTARDETGQDLALTEKAVAQHVSGEKPLGVYLFDLQLCQTRVRCGVFDLDSHKGETEWAVMLSTARSIRGELSRRGIQSAWFRSSGGRGIHIWLTFESPVPASDLKNFMEEVLEANDLKSGSDGGLAAGRVEVFPKQERVKTGGYGNLVALPLAGQSCPLDEDGNELCEDQWREAVQSVPQNGPDALEITSKAINRKPGRPRKERELYEHPMEACAFVQHCHDNAAALSEPLWYSLATNCAAAEGGKGLFHRLSKIDSQRYDQTEAEAKLDHGAEAAAPHTCRAIGDAGFACPRMDASGRCSIHRGTRPVDFMQDAKSRIAQIRKSDLLAEVKNREIAKVVLVDLQSLGVFLKVEATERLIYFDWGERQLYDLDSSDFSALCNERYEINASTGTWRYLIEHLKAFCRRQGAPTTVYRVSVYRDGILYLDAGGNELLRLNGQTIERLPNGTDSILFEPDDVEPVDDSAIPTNDEIISHVGSTLREFLVDALPGASSMDKALYHVYILLLFFESLLPTKPILLLNGSKGSGKTSAARALKRALHGQHGEVSSGFTNKEQDAIAAIVNNYVLIADNVDGMVSWMANLLASVATGTAISMRKLYANNVELKFVPRCFVIITSRDPVSLKRDDIADRLLMIDLASRPKAFQAEGDLQRGISEARMAIWKDLLVDLSWIVRHLSEEGLSGTSNHRLADWARLATTIGDIVNVGDVRGALEELSDRRKDFVLQDNAVYEGILAWIEQGKSKDENGHVRELSTGDLFQEIVSIYAIRNCTGGRASEFPIRSSRAFGKELANMMPELSMYFEITIREGQARKKYVRIVPKSLSDAAA